MFLGVKLLVKKPEKASKDAFFLLNLKFQSNLNQKCPKSVTYYLNEPLELIRNFSGEVINRQFGL